MNRDRNTNEYYEHFPYLSYEEILEVKRRRRRRRKSVIAGLGAMFFCTMLAVVIGLKVSSRSLISWLGAGSELQGRMPDVTGTGTAGNQSAISGLELTPQPAAEQESAMVAWDVTGVVKAAAQSVVGVNCEQYSSFTQTSSGSGIIVGEGGYIITNHHVISNGDSISVTLHDGTAYPAFLVGADTFTDLAVLKIDAPDLTPAQFGDSDLVEAGQPAIAIGNPTGMLFGTVTMGIVSAVNRDILINNTVMNLIQTDASINSGNSGGPLLNQYGQVVGVTSVKINRSGYEGLGFAIPINTVKPIVEQLISQGYVSGRPLLGIKGQEISAIASVFNNIPQGILIHEIQSSSDAYEQGMRTGDIIVSVNGQRVTSLSKACAQRNLFAAGDSITIGVHRSGREYEVTVRLLEQNQDTSDLNF